MKRRKNKRNESNKHGNAGTQHSCKRRYNRRNLCRTTNKQRKDIDKQVQRPAPRPKVPVLFYKVRKGREILEVSERDVDVMSLQLDGYRVMDKWREWL